MLGGSQAKLKPKGTIGHERIVAGCNLEHRSSKFMFFFWLVCYMMEMHVTHKPRIQHRVVHIRRCQIASSESGGVWGAPLKSVGPKQWVHDCPWSSRFHIYEWYNFYRENKGLKFHQNAIYSLHTILLCPTAIDTFDLITLSEKMT